MSLELPYGGKRLDSSANFDEMYGTYNSIEEACNTIGEGLRKLGRTVGIIENGKVVEYWWESGITDEDLVQKQVSVGGFSGFFKNIVKDGEFTAEKNEEDEYEFKIAGDTELEWEIGDNSFTKPLVDDELIIIAPPLGAGVERRIDAVSYGNDGEVHHWKGSETGQASYPNIPENHILRTFVTIGVNGMIATTVDSIVKGSETWIGLNLSAVFVPPGETTLEYDLDVHGNQRNIHITHVPLGVEELVIRQFVEFPFYDSISPMWSGATARIYNRTNVPIKVLHQHSSHPNGKPIYLPHNVDLIINPTEVASFSRMGMSANFRYVLSELCYGNAVDLESNQTITGIKSFAQAPIIYEIATTPLQALNLYAIGSILEGYLKKAGHNYSLGAPFLLQCYNATYNKSTSFEVNPEEEKAKYSFDFDFDNNVFLKEITIGKDGIKSNTEFTPVNDKDFVQKKYVDDPQRLISLLQSANPTQINQIQDILGITR